MLKGRTTHVRYAALADIDRGVQTTTYDQVPQLQTGSYQPVLDRLGMDSQALSDRMYPVKLNSGECVILVLPEYVRDDAVLAMRIAMQQVGLILATRCLVVVSPSVLGAVVRQNRLQTRQPFDFRGAARTTSGHVLFSLLDEMLLWALEHRASDLHLTVSSLHSSADVAFTVRSCLVRPEQFSQITAEMAQELLAVTWMRVEGGNGAVFEPMREQQGRLERCVAGQMLSLRWASVVSHRGPAVTLRILGRDLDPTVQTLEKLGYGEHQLDSFYRARLAQGGAVIVAGAVGSGKSTTLATLIRSLPANRKVMTLEDPIEFDLPNAIQCAVTGFGDTAEDESRFDLKLRALKRSAANDVLIGELRDQGSARALSDLLVAGTNVYTTIHAGSALQIVQRLMSPMLGVCAEVLRVPGVLKLLVYQTLLNELCPRCCLSEHEWLSQKVKLNALGVPLTQQQAQRWLDDFSSAYGLCKSVLRFRCLDGCGDCRHSKAYNYGYHGSLLSAEIVEPQRLPGFWTWMRQAASLAERRDSGHELSFERCPQNALQYVVRGRLDPREYELRFGQASNIAVQAELDTLETVVRC